MGEKMVDKVFRLMENPQHIRNIATCAHIDHGKTTFSDNLLAGAGMMSKDDAGKALKLDFHDDEQERGITIDTAAVSMVHQFDGKEYLINLLDTPGHVDFGGDVTRAMRAVDGAIVLCCAVEGIMPQTETVLRQALKERVKPVLYINKVDRLIKEVKLTPEGMQKKFIDIINNVNRLIKEIAEKEYGEKWKVSVQDGSVAFGSAFHNWGLSLPYMQRKGITFKDVIEAYSEPNEQKLKENIKALAEKAPLHEVVLNMVIRHHPNPVQAQNYRIPKIWHGDLESEEGKSLQSCNRNGPLFFVCTKIVIDPQAGEIAAGRLFSGTMRKGQEVYLSMAKTTGRVQQVFVYNGAKREIVDNVPCGNIIGVAGLKTFVGETASENETEPFEKISHIFEPVITKAIEATKPADLPKLIEILRIVGKEDPTIQIEINEETGENLMHGMGELHLEVIENRIRDEKGLEVKTSDPIVVYRETVTKKGPEVEGKTPNKHNKFYFYVEPLEEPIREAIKKGELPEMRIKKKDLAIRDKLVECGMDSKTAIKVKNIFKGNMLVEQTRGLVHIGEVMEMVQDMFENVMTAGPLAKEPSIGVKVVFTDAKLHEDAIHRGPAQVYPALRESIRGSMMQARPVIFEPYQVLHIEAPNEFMGELSKLISNKRGQLLDMQQEGSLVVIKAKMPVAELLGWSSALRSATGGRGNSSLVDQMFEKVPEEMQQKVTMQIKNRKGLTDAMVGA
jgi:elongation factor 2